MLGKGVEVVEAGVVGGGGDGAVAGHGVEAPWGKDEEGTVYAGIEARLLGLPVWADGLFLQVYEGKVAKEALVLDELLAGRDAWGDDHGGALHDLLDELVVLHAIGSGGFVGDAEGCLAVAEDLQLARPSQQEEVAEGGIFHAVDDDVQLSLHELGEEAAEDGAARVVGHVCEHALAMGIAQADGVVVVVVEEGALNEGTGGVVGAAVFYAAAAD